MKTIKTLLIFLLLAVCASGAFAHGRARVGVYFGGPAWGPWYGPSPWYYLPQVIVVPPPAPPPVYIEQQEAQPAAAENQYWYYCQSAKGYYPYVKECPGGWQKVLPQPER